MEDINVLVKEALEQHQEFDGQCLCRHPEWPCPERRIADDWMRLRSDLSRSWRNKSVEEIKLNNPFFCCMCSGRETGLVCERCIMEADAEIDSS